MKKYVAFGTLALAAALPLSALAQNIATVNGVAIPSSRFKAITDNAAASGQKISPEQEKQIKQELIDVEIYTQEAKRRGLDNTEQFKNQVAMMQQQALVQALQADLMKNAPAISDAETKAEYDRVAGGQAKEYKARHILVDTEQKANELIAEIKKGAKFADVAKKNSKDPGSGAKGGDLGWANPSGFVAEFSNAMKALSKGQMTQTPVKSQFGYHIILLDDVRDNKTAQKLPPYDQVKERIVQGMKQKKVQQQLQDLKTKAKIS